MGGQEEHVLAWLAQVIGVSGRARPAHAILGARGEREAARFLKARGYRVLARNFKAPMGEIDLIALSPDRALRVIVEVKTRTVSDEPSPLARPAEAAVDHDKRSKLATLAGYVARCNQWPPATIRIDVVAVDFQEGREPAIRHFRGVPGAHAVG